MRNERIAKALGWKHPRKEQTWAYWTRPDGAPFGKNDLPRWTTSLDQIVREIDALKLKWKVDSGLGTRGHVAQIYAKDFKGFHDERFSTAFAKTAPLALCTALLSHLKDFKP